MSHSQMKHKNDILYIHAVRSQPVVAIIVSEAYCESERELKEKYDLDSALDNVMNCN